MSPSWWQVPYKGGGPAKVRGFPRPLYPPAAKNKGKTPSKDGPDVVAVKRTISRLGRWPWQAFDDHFSDRFSLGNPSSAVEHSGVAGFQRQMAIDDTGWIGEPTFQALRYALVPDHLPHAGEQAMDARACELIDQAFELYAGKPASSAPLKRKAIPSPNYSSRAGATVRLIVLHTAEGARTIEDLGAFFASSTSGVSSHVGIDDTPGTVGEYVKRGSKAWTAANANPVAVQAELCGFASWTRSEWLKHEAMLENAARWIREEAEAFGLPISKLTSSQAQGGGRGVCQHADLGSWGGGHWDCGDGFPFDDVLAEARA